MGMAATTKEAHRKYIIQITTNANISKSILIHFFLSSLFKILICFGCGKRARARVTSDLFYPHVACLFGRKSARSRDPNANTRIPSLDSLHSSRYIYQSLCIVIRKQQNKFEREKSAFCQKWLSLSRIISRKLVT